MNLKNNFDKKALFRIAIFIIAAIIIGYFYPENYDKDYKYTIGKPWTYSLLTAPFDMPIMPDSATVEHKTDSINKAFIPVCKVNQNTENEVIAKIDNEMVVNILQKIYKDGIIDSDITKNSSKIPDKIRIINGNIATSVSTKKMKTVKEAYEFVDSATGSNFDVRRLNLAQIIMPNIVLDTVMTERLLNEAYQSAVVAKGMIQQGERIVDLGEIVTPQTATLLKTYEKMIKDRGVTADEHYSFMGYILIVILMLALLYAFFRLYRTEIYQNGRKLTFAVALVTVFSISAFTLFHMFHNAIFFVPVAIVPILIITFFDSRTAFFTSMVQVIICSLATTEPLMFIILHLPVSAIAINSLQELTKRSQLIRTAALVFLGYSFIYLAYTIFSSGNINAIMPKAFLFFGINAIFLSFTYVLIFVLERLFGFTSKVTLVELADVNNPLLRELSEKCPGTFQHSLQLSNLVSEAAHEIRANSQLARAGALYHDIGKMENPAFFTENQHDINPHELITPEQSAKIVIRHVTDGMKIAEKAKLPTVIKDFITEHHGKNVAKFFYTTACNNNGGEPVDPEPYTYPGPNPQSKETSLLMMADATEAASRSLKEYSDEAIKNLVNKIIDGQIAQGLMKDSPLSFKDVEKIKKVFISRLRTMYHTRVSYPELNKKEDKKNV